MGGDIKALRTRIRSVDATLHLTKAMGLVASSKIRRAMTAMANGRQYAEAVSHAVRMLSACPECEKSPYLYQSTGQKQKTKLIVIAADRGLAGGYNANVFRFVKQFEQDQIIPIGKRACERYGSPVCSSETFSYTDAASLSKTLCSAFCNREFDRLGIVSTQYFSMMQQEPTVTWVFPLARNPKDASKSVLFEPNEMEILNAVVPEYVTGILIAAVRESFACEVAARRVAMDAAGKNAQQMIDSLQLAYNRARQSAITQEITEIVAGSNA